MIPYWTDEQIEEIKKLQPDQPAMAFNRIADPTFQPGGFTVVYEKTNQFDDLVLKAGDKAVTWTYTPILGADGKWKCVPNNDLKLPAPCWSKDGTKI